ncbi:LCP family protein [Streptomyces sp. DSM 44917]|uniref:LCP family protein n=1 Tax=Streptomyces boetiae TaxID=3075541 RepID=A0ABU2LF74_9ACTN|nr:LCP family protein [Streptomyces sp. DSM 44917]MDT0310240.1 LCP family protein [Streptomyces sp. DSM 44917]
MAATQGAGRPGRHRSRHPNRPERRRRPRWGVRLAAGLASLVLAAGGIGHAVVTSADRGVHRVDPFGSLRDAERPGDGGGLNVLLVGTDSREGLSAAERGRLHVGDASCNCADAVLVLHVSERGDRATVVGLPRDSYATLPTHTFASTGERHEAHPDKLNAALSHGGPSLMVSTVEGLTGLRIDHYLELSFAGFLRAVDELGGVEVCTPEPLRDPQAGLDLRAGTTRLDGAAALAYVRARHTDGTGDLGRMERQQRFLTALLRQAVAGGVLLDPARLTRTVGAVLDSLRADPGLGPEQLVELARLFGGFGASAVDFTSVPIADPGRSVPGLGSTVVWDEKAADRLFAALREDRSPPAEDAPPAPDDARPAERGAAHPDQEEPSTCG